MARATLAPLGNGTGICNSASDASGNRLLSVEGAVEAGSGLGKDQQSRVLDTDAALHACAIGAELEPP